VRLHATCVNKVYIMACDLLNCSLINLQHSKFASAELNIRGHYDLTLITEPYSHRGLIRTLKTRNHELFYKLGVDRPRACIRANKKWKAWAVPQFTTVDMAVASLQVGDDEMWFASVYLDIQTEVRQSAGLVQLLEYCDSQRIPLVIGMDSNAHNLLWGSVDTNKRGEHLEEVMEEYNCMLCNVGSVPTFSSARAESVIDLVWINDMANRISVQEWRVDPRPSFSDHRYVLFKVAASCPGADLVRNLKKCNWERFEYLVEAGLPDEPDALTSIEAVDEAACALQEVLQKALDECAPRRRPKTGQAVPWLSAELLAKRAEVMRADRDRPFTRGPESYQKLYSDYRHDVRKAKEASWRSFCSSVTATKDIARVVRGLQGDAQAQIGLMKNESGVYETDPAKVVSLLLRTHFPMSTKAAPVLTGSAVAWSEEIYAATDFIKEEVVAIALKSFGPNKSAGPDDLKPMVLQHLGAKALKSLAALYRASVTLGYVPTCWREMKVVFIPKLGKDDYGLAKSFRPITLSNFVLKGLERIVQWFLNENFLQTPLLNQHAYTAGYSTDTALSEVVDVVERGIYQDNLVLAVSLDCTGAFDYISFYSAETATRDLGVPDFVNRWYQHLLRGRRVTADIRGYSDHVYPKRGSPQGGVLSPLIWNVIMNTLLTQFRVGPVKAIGYADDIMLLITGKDIGSMTDLMQKAINKVASWGDDNGLTFNPSKTQAMLFGFQYKKQTKPLHIKGVNVSYTDSMKYLGLTLDPKLSWKPHIDDRVAKCARIWHHTRCIVGQKWGFKTHRLMWIYKAMIRPVISYGSIVWAHRLNQTLSGKLVKVQRRALLSITSALRSTPTAGMEVVLGLLPLDLHVKREATRSRWRTRNLVNDRWDGLGRLPTRRGHRKIHDNIIGSLSLQEGDEKPGKVTLKNKVNFVEVPDPPLVLYTDGSKVENGKVGAGWAIVRDGEVLEEESLRLNNDASVFQAEILALTEGGRCLSREPFRDCPAVIWSDSQAAIQAVKNHQVKSNTVQEARDVLMKRCERTPTDLRWAKAHNDTTGNELADHLAKMGAAKATVDKTICPGTSWIVRKIDEYYNTVWLRRWKDADGMVISKAFYPEPNDKLDWLLTLCRTKLGVLTQAATGHGLYGRHLAHWRSCDRVCERCGEEAQSSWHLWENCPAFAALRMQTRDSPGRGALDYELRIIDFFSNPEVTRTMEANLV
jgi:ribonuclease HI